MGHAGTRTWVWSFFSLAFLPQWITVPSSGAGLSVPLGDSLHPLQVPLVLCLDWLQNACWWAEQKQVLPSLPGVRAPATNVPSAKA
jgi:hypothetical protein